MHGLLLIDKPAGMTSHDVVRRVRRICATRKVGHAGTLDPLATGVLPVAVGEGTKLLQFLLAADKSYRATLRLGVTTDTLDAEGEVLSRTDPPADALSRLPELLARFRGDIEQVPPMYSALKRNGVPLYRLARAGQSVEREPRRVHIARLELIEADLPELTIEVDCSKGTYIRSLCADLGQNLGCGAHLTALRRTRSGRFGEECCIPLDELENPQRAHEVGALLSMDEALVDFPAFELQEEAVARLKNGVPPQCGECAAAIEVAEDDLVRLVGNGRLLAMARFAPRRSRERRSDFELLRVFNL